MESCAIMQENIFDTDVNFWSHMSIMCVCAHKWTRLHIPAHASHVHIDSSVPCASAWGNGSAENNQSCRWKAPTHFPDGDGIVLWQQWQVFIKIFQHQQRYYFPALSHSNDSAAIVQILLCSDRSLMPHTVITHLVSWVSKGWQAFRFAVWSS